MATPDLLSRTATRLRSAGCVFAEDEADLLVTQAGDEAELDLLVSRRLDGTPLEVIVGWTSFAGLRVEVAAGVFIPRQRTQFLVEVAAGLVGPGATVVDMCCGSGAIGLAIAHAVPGIDLHACDVDPTAVRCAARNLVDVGGHVYCGDLFSPLPDRLRGATDLVVANAPYVPTDEIAFMPPEARDHEPRHTLDGGPEGIDIHRRIADEVTDWLRPGGHVLIETGRGQAPLTEAALAHSGATATTVTSDELFATVVVGRFGVERPDPLDS
ncbi:putative protein N(5)-glutamine methyltransferase [Gordonia sp. NPDC003424]